MVERVACANTIALDGELVQVAAAVGDRENDLGFHVHAVVVIAQIVSAVAAGSDDFRHWLHGFSVCDFAALFTALYAVTAFHMPATSKLIGV
ncbi:MAG: hypothetical protein ACKVOO_12495 [Burkholderiaceae bacterium]